MNGVDPEISPRPDPHYSLSQYVHPVTLAFYDASLEAKLRSSGQIQNHLLAVAVFTSALMAWRMVFAIALQVREGVFEELLPALMFMMPLTVLPLFIVFVTAYLDPRRAHLPYTRASWVLSAGWAGVQADNVGRL